MKTYDFNKAHAFIEQHKASIVSASLGMNEDWFWTAGTVFEDGEYKMDLLDPDLWVTIYQLGQK